MSALWDTNQWLIAITMRQSKRWQDYYDYYGIMRYYSMSYSGNNQ